jgi:hypothetical protein
MWNCSTRVFTGVAKVYLPHIILLSPAPDIVATFLGYFTPETQESLTHIDALSVSKTSENYTRGLGTCRCVMYKPR